MSEVDLLCALPRIRRNVAARKQAKTEAVIKIARQFGEMYFDGPRTYGYGGYRYDGRWKPVAKDIIRHFGLKPGDKVLDVGCAKGFLIKDLLAEGIDAFGIDISKYALMNCEPETIGRLQIGSAEELPFPDGSFSAVLSINTLHNLTREGCLQALREIERLAPGCGFVQVDSYTSLEAKALFENWVLTAVFHDFPQGWLNIFAEAGYTGDWNWTFVE